MTKAELIELIERFPDDAEVCVRDVDGDSHRNVYAVMSGDRVAICYEYDR